MFFETELEWLVYHLWTKTGARSPVFSFQIADTVVLREGVPQTWFFSSKDGYILKKNACNVKMAKIHKTFIKRNKKVEENPAAVAYHYIPQVQPRTGEERMALQTEYVTCGDLSMFLKKSV